MVNCGARNRAHNWTKLIFLCANLHVFGRLQWSIQVAAAPASEVCSLVASTGDAQVGIAVTTDASCKTVGGVGCFGADSVCRYCQTTSTLQSQHLMGCGVIANVPPPTSTSSPASSPASVVPVTATEVPVCSITVSSGDAAVGIDIVSDEKCVQGGLGCLNGVCRYCRRQVTPQSGHYLSCDSIDSGSSPVRVPAPTSRAPVPAPTMPTPTPMPSSSTPTTTTPIANYCSALLISSAKADVGIWAALDPSCPRDPDGCHEYCRLCKFKETSASTQYCWCSTIIPSVETSAPVAPANPDPPPSNQCTDTLAQDKVDAGIWLKPTCLTETNGICSEMSCSSCKYFETHASENYPPCDDPVSIDELRV